MIEDSGSFVSLTPNMSPFCVADSEDSDYDIEKKVKFFEDLVGIKPKKKITN